MPQYPMPPAVLDVSHGERVSVARRNPIAQTDTNIAALPAADFAPLAATCNVPAVAVRRLNVPAVAARRLNVPAVAARRLNVPAVGLKVAH